MEVLKVRNVNQALHDGLIMLWHQGRKRSSRNGEVRVLDTPVTTVYEKPAERVLFWEARDANPFFHLYESLWMLGGRRDVDSIAFYVDRMRTFSDDGSTLHGAYGHRWLFHFGFDQLAKIGEALRINPEDRRCVLQVWDAENDLAVSSKDIPCNTHAYFSVSYEGNLDMTVSCRSNDIIWGAYGANAVHWSMLQEYVAALAKRPVGTYYQVSNNYHAYTDVFQPLFDELMANHLAPFHSVYGSRIKPYPLVNTDPEEWGRDLESFLDEPAGKVRDPFFSCVAVPAHDAYRFHKDGSALEALKQAEKVQATDWRLAMVQWLQRRNSKEFSDALHSP